MVVDLSKYVDSLRQILRDIETPDTQGYFWTPTEISLALNMAQTIFCRYVITTKQFYYFDRLRVTLDSMSTVYRFQASDPPMMYPIGAWIRDQSNNIWYARIYLGDGAGFLSVGHNACIIINDTVSFITRQRITGGASAVSGILHYYRYPYKIYVAGEISDSVLSIPSTNWDFPNNVYERIIVPYGAIILGLKEITNQRDNKYFKYVMSNILNMPSSFANFINDYEFTGLKERAGRPPSQDITEEQ